MVKRRLSDCEYIIFLMDVCPTTETASSNGNRPYKIGRMLSGDLKVEPLLCHILAGGMPGSLRRFPRGQWPLISSQCWRRNPRPLITRNPARPISTRTACGTDESIQMSRG